MCYILRMTSTYDAPVILVLGAGPGLGMSIAHRFGRAGHRVALVSRSADRHPGYLAELDADGISAIAVAADVTDPEQLRAAVDDVRARLGRVDVAYVGLGGMDGPRPGDIRDIAPSDLAEALSLLQATVQAVSLVLPEMRARGTGGLLFAGGLSAVVPMPMLGALSPTAAALRTYALTLHEALREEGVYAGTLIIGGAIERGDIHRHVLAHPETFGDIGQHTLDPDEIAERAWHMFSERNSPELVFNALTPA